MDWRETFLQILYPLDESSVDIEAAYALKHENIPEKIYKYRDINDYSLSNLREGTIWLASPESLNDPYECSLLVDRMRMTVDLRKALPKEQKQLLTEMGVDIELLTHDLSAFEITSMLVDRLMPTDPEDAREKIKQDLIDVQKKMYNRMGNSLSDQLQKTFKLCSFSERLDSTLMWAHYAKCHEGFCIEYNVKELPASDLRSRFLYPAIYQDEMFDATSYFESHKNGARVNSLFLTMGGLIKAKDWSYEKEWRLIFAHDIFPSARSYSMPKPTHVYLGARIKPEDQAEIIAICDTIGVATSKVSHCRTKFKMEVQPVD